MKDIDGFEHFTTFADLVKHDLIVPAPQGDGSARPPYRTNLSRLIELHSFAMLRWHQSMNSISGLDDTPVQKLVERTERWFAAVERFARLIRLVDDRLHHA